MGNLDQDEQLQVETGQDYRDMAATNGFAKLKKFVEKRINDYSDFLLNCEINEVEKYRGRILSLKEILDEVESSVIRMNKLNNK